MTRAAYPTADRGLGGSPLWATITRKATVQTEVGLIPKGICHLGGNTVSRKTLTVGVDGIMVMTVHLPTLSNIVELLCSFPAAAVINPHQLGGLKWQSFILPQF